MIGQKKGFRHSEATKLKMRKDRKTLLVDARNRFWKLVDKNGPVHPIHGQCWIWTGNTYPDGYGRFWFDGRNVRVHKYSWFLHKKVMTSSKLHLCHKCDNILCVNPTHLFVGTYRDNIDDMLQKGRSLKGEKHNFAKLTEEQAIEALKWYRGCGELLKDTAARMKVSVVCLELVRSGTNWKHLYHLHSQFEDDSIPKTQKQLDKLQKVSFMQNKA